MSHFQISPPKAQGKLAAGVTTEDETSIPSYLVLGAFSVIPKVHFETVALGQSKKRTLIIRNPGDQGVWLKICKKPSRVFHLNYDDDPIIQPKDQFVLDITWTPTEEGQTFEAFQFSSSLGGIKSSVHLLGVCIAPPPAKNSKFRRRPLVSSQNTKPSALVQKKTLVNHLDGVGITIPRTPFNRENCTSSIAESSRPLVQPDLQLPITANTFTDMDGTKCNSEINNMEVVTPPRNGTSVSCLLDNFAFPFTPDVHARKEVSQIFGCSSPAVVRRETFLIEEEGLFLQGQIASPTRRETYLVSAKDTCNQIQGGLIRGSPSSTGTSFFDIKSSGSNFTLKQQDSESQAVEGLVLLSSSDILGETSNERHVIPVLEAPRIGEDEELDILAGRMKEFLSNFDNCFNEARILLPELRAEEDVMPID